MDKVGSLHANSIINGAVRDSPYILCSLRQNSGIMKSATILKTTTCKKSTWLWLDYD